MTRKNVQSEKLKEMIYDQKKRTKHIDQGQ